MAHILIESIPFPFKSKQIKAHQSDVVIEYGTHVVLRMLYIANPYNSPNHTPIHFNSVPLTTFFPRIQYIESDKLQVTDLPIRPPQVPGKVCLRKPQVLHKVVSHTM